MTLIYKIPGSMVMVIGLISSVYTSYVRGDMLFNLTASVVQIQPPRQFMPYTQKKSTGILYLKQEARFFFVNKLLW